LVEQLWAAGEAPSRLYYASGSRGTQAGLMLGAKMYSASYDPVGVAVSEDGPEKTERAVRLAREAATLLRADTRITAGDVLTDPRHLGPGYGVATPECLEAMAILARCEGILLDPVYTGKAMAALIHDVRHGALAGTDEASVVFLHTGGTPAIFSYADRLTAAFEREHTPA
ncbi:MAG: pyridoxal-phosphate dependent enzyme, partial [Gemmatimonadaceae bacterium]